MTPGLKNFLTATDLDYLSSARAEISEMNADDIIEIMNILKQWSDVQKISNLLMHSDLIPAKDRLNYVLKGLNEKKNKYLVLAASIGLYQIDIEVLNETEQSNIVERLIEIVEQENDMLAERASTFLADKLIFLQKNYATHVVGLLNHSSELVKHNMLVALIHLVGLENIRKFFDTALESAKLSKEGRLYAEGQLRTIKGLGEDNKVAGAQIDLGWLSKTLLSYVPNLKEWPLE